MAVRVGRRMSVTMRVASGRSGVTRVEVTLVGPRAEEMVMDLGWRMGAGSGGVVLGS